MFRAEILTSNFIQSSALLSLSVLITKQMQEAVHDFNGSSPFSREQVEQLQWEVKRVCWELGHDFIAARQQFCVEKYAEISLSQRRCELTK